MGGMLDSIKKSTGTPETQAPTLLLKKNPIGIEFEMPGASYTITMHSRYVIINDAIKGERFIMSSDDEFTVLEVELVSCPENRSSIDYWEFKIKDQAGSMLYKKADVAPIERIVRHRGDFSECAVGGHYYVQETPVGLYLISKVNGAEIKIPCKALFNPEKGGAMIEYKQGHFVFKRDAEVIYKGFDVDGAMFDIVSGISLDSAPEHLYQNITNAIFGYGEPSWKGMILCNMLRIDKQVENDSVEALQNMVGERVSHLFGYHMFNGNPMSTADEDAQRNSLFPLLFGTEVAYDLMKGREYESYAGVQFAGMGHYKLYKDGD